MIVLRSLCPERYESFKLCLLKVLISYRNKVSTIVSLYRVTKGVSKALKKDKVSSNDPLTERSESD